MDLGLCDISLSSFPESLYNSNLELDSSSVFFVFCFFLICRILANWLKVKFMGDEGSVDDTSSDAGGIQTLSLFNSLSSKGDQMISVNVCIKVNYNYFVFTSVFSLLSLTPRYHWNHANTAYSLMWF